MVCFCFLSLFFLLDMVQEAFPPVAVRSLARVGSCVAPAGFWVPSQVALYKLVHYQLSPQHGVLPAPSKPAIFQARLSLTGFLPALGRLAEEQHP